MRRLDLRAGSALIIVAHPDDETIWMGGTILAHPNIRWTMLSLCRSDDPDRAPKFKKACRLYGAKCIISNLEDEKIMGIEESIPEIRKRIAASLSKLRTKPFTPSDQVNLNIRGGNKKSALQKLDNRTIINSGDLTGFTCVFTHGYNGEYGHPRHLGVRQAVTQMIKSKELPARQLFYFAYRRRERRNQPMVCVPNSHTTFGNTLSDQVHLKKKFIIEKIYGFSQTSFEYRSCSRLETFREANI